MELKRVLAADSRAAKEKAISLYGRDALILSNDRVNGQVELIVAVDLVADDALFPTPPRPAAATSAPSSPLIQPPPFSKVMQGTMQRLRQKPAEGRAAPATDLPQPEDGERERERAQELVAMVKAELAEMRREIRISRETSVWERSANLPIHVQDLATRMREANISAALRTLLIDEVKAADTQQQAMDHIRTTLQTLLQRKAMAGPLRGTHVVAGPSGGGKTVMMRNIANAHIPVHGSENMAIISYNDNRVGAWPQLQLLSAAAGIECYKVKSAESLRELIDSLSDKKLVIVDTPGSQIVENASAVRQAVDDAVFHLVLPADASASTVNRFLQLQDIKWHSLMLTKLDECTNPWPLLQMLNEQTLPISFESTNSLLGNPDAVKRTIEKMIEAGIALLPVTDSLHVPAQNRFAGDQAAQPIRH